MDEMFQLKSKQRNRNNASSYATADDFQHLFSTEMADLLRLALLLTADAESAERSLILAKTDCIHNSAVSKDWVHVWARRTVIRQAIQVVMGAEYALPETPLNVLQPRLESSPGQYAMEALAESLAVLSLPRLERLVFVICGIERYSIQDCSLLLNESANSVGNALRRATSRLVASEMQRHNRAEDTAADSNVAGERDGPCGTHLGSAVCARRTD